MIMFHRVVLVYMVHGGVGPPLLRCKLMYPKGNLF